MILQNTSSHLILTGLIAGAVLYMSFALFAMGMISINWLLINFIVINLIFMLELVRDRSSAVRNSVYIILGIIYIAIPFALLNFLYDFDPLSKDYNPIFLLGYFILSWVYDTMAYVGGSLFGRTKLFPEVSPSKTWEGVILGGIITLGVAGAVAYFFGHISLLHWLVVGVIIIVFGTFGDLAESLFKRNFNMKDAGKVLPGHGGVLDRFDGLLFSAPAVLFYYYLIA